MKTLILTLLIAVIASCYSDLLYAGAATGSRNKCFPVVRRFDSHATLTIMTTQIPPMFYTSKNPNYNCTYAVSQTGTYNGAYAYARVGLNVSTIRTTVSKWNAIAGMGYLIPQNEPSDSYGYSKGDNSEFILFDSANHAIQISDFTGYISTTLGTGYGSTLLYVIWDPESEEDSVITVNEVLSKGRVSLENGQIVTDGFFNSSDFYLTVEPDSGSLVPVLKANPSAGLSKTIPIDTSINLDSVKVSVFCEGGYGPFYESHIIKPFHQTYEVRVLFEGYFGELTNQMRRGDSATAYIRESSPPYFIYDSAKALIDGDGYGVFEFYRKSPTDPNKRISVRHSKCVSIWSFNTIDTSMNYHLYDFTSTSASVYGSNVARVGLAPFKYAMYSGDVNQDETIDATDLSYIDNDASNFVSGDVITDLTGDLFVDGTDFLLADNNAYNFVSVINP